MPAHKKKKKEEGFIKEKDQETDEESLGLFGYPARIFTFHLSVYLRHGHHLRVCSVTFSHLYAPLKISANSEATEDLT